MIFSLIIFNLVFLGLIQFKAYKKKLDIIDLLILPNVLYFGIWPLFSLMGNNSENLDQEGIRLLSCAIIFLAFILIWIINLLIVKCLKFPKYNSFVNLDSIIFKSFNISNSKIFFLVIFIILFIMYGFLAYGISKSFSFDGMAELGINLPFWYLSVFSSIRMLIFLSIIILSIKYFISKNKIFLFFLFLITLISLIYGKASLAVNLIMIYFLYLKICNNHLFNLKIILSIIILAFFTLLAFNFFENIRAGLLAPSAYEDVKFNSGASKTFISKAKNINLETLMNFDTVIEKLNKRPSVFKFNVMILDWQLSKNKYNYVTYGEMLFSSALNLVPRYIWHSKPENNLQKNMLFPRYNETYYAFQAPSILGFTIADFGFLAVIIFPLLMIILLLITMFLSSIFYKHNLSYLTLYSGLLYNFLSVEANYDSYILVLRNSLFFAILFLVFSLSLKGGLSAKRNH